MAKGPRKSIGGMQLPMFAPTSDWVPPSLGTLPDWSQAKRVAIDTETKDVDLKKLGPGCRRPGNYIVGYSFAIEDGPKFYIPVRHGGGGNVDCKQAFDYLRNQARNFTGIVVGANISYDLDWLATEQVDFPSVEFIRDVQVADPLINELHNSYALKAIAQRHGLPGKDETLLVEAAREFGVDPKGGLHHLHSKYVGAYGEEDAASLHAILRKQERIIDEEDLWDIYNLESQVTPVLVRMRQRGVRIDFDHLGQVEEWSISQERDALDFVARETGKQVGVGNVWSADAMAKPLLEIGVDVPLTTKGKYSVDADLLTSIDHPVGEKLAWARKVNKLRTTFAASVRRYSVNGRIHCSFKQIAQDDGFGKVQGARYGRLSCIDPNLQQQPSRDSFAKMWRKVYIPEEGALWASNDYSQQEPRWTTHFAAEMDLPKAREVAQRYCNDPNMDNHDMMTRLIHSDEQVDAWLAGGDPLYKKNRTTSKDIFLGLCYGEGGAKLAHDIGLPTQWACAVRSEAGRRVRRFETREEAFEWGMEHDNKFIWEVAGEEAQGILDNFDEEVPYVRKLAETAKRTAGRRGFVKTILGRRLRFKALPDGSYDDIRKALNRIIQGSSADQTKKAIVEIDRQGYFVQLQVHDELASSVENQAEARAIGDIMEQCIPNTRVPFKVDVEVGESWGDSME